jgi:hypothetical protein
MWNVKTKVPPVIMMIKKPSQNPSENICETYRENNK